MTVERELVSLAEAARRIGCHRSKLSVLCRDADVQKVRKEGKDLVAWEDAQGVFQTAISDGRIQATRKGATTVDTGSTASSTTFSTGSETLQDGYETLIRHFKDALEQVKAERDALATRLQGLEDELLLLPAGRLTTPAIHDPTDLKAITAVLNKCRGVTEEPPRRRGILGRLFGL